MIASVAHAGVGGYVVLYFGVAASWIGIPIVGAGALAGAGMLASEGELNIWLVIVVATVAPRGRADTCATSWGHAPPAS